MECIYLGYAVHFRCNLWIKPVYQNTGSTWKRIPDILAMIWTRIYFTNQKWSYLVYNYAIRKWTNLLSNRRSSFIVSKFVMWAIPMHVDSPDLYLIAIHISSSRTNGKLRHRFQWEGAEFCFRSEKNRFRSHKLIFPASQRKSSQFSSGVCLLSLPHHTY